MRKKGAILLVFPCFSQGHSHTILLVAHLRRAWREVLLRSHATKADQHAIAVEVADRAFQVVLVAGIVNG